MKLKKETALNLPLEGSVGSFNVGTGRPGQNSLEVKYFLTHVGLDFASGSNEAVLSHLAPVREIFDFEQLDFDEIMQRDIDDARVSGELIPYLLDSKSADLIKLFPPIIVVVLPKREGENRPDKLYPEVEQETVKRVDEDHETLITRSGPIGQEVFQFEQPISGADIIKHDLVRFKLNTHKTRLVIVDGQHRAMALLALYRNLQDEWSDEKRAPFKEYYAEWTRNYIQQFNLKEINLPVMFCTFPQLCEGYSGDYDLKKAARAIFLTLNKTARKVSNSRNILLDDNDIVAYFLRRCLSHVKQKDMHSPYSLRIFNVELDQFDDQMRISSPIAVTGVNHVYYIIEHLLFNKGDEDVNGAKPRSGKFGRRKDLNTYSVMDRLDGRDLIGAQVADSTTRDTYTEQVAEKLSESFYDKYGRYIISTFEKFKPYEIHNKAVLDLESRLEIHEDRKLRPILFEGQGMGRVFETHRENLKQKLKEGSFETDVPEIHSLSQRLDDTATRKKFAVEKFEDDRVGKYLEQVSDKSKLKLDEGNWHPKIVSFYNDLYKNVFTTVAFETALVCAFFGEIERANQIAKRLGEPGLDISSNYDEYLGQLNDFLLPNSSAQFKKLVKLFAGEFEGEIRDWKIIPSKQTFRSIVFEGEMQPEQWPKYKYLILEIWHPSNNMLSQAVSSQRDKCRMQIFNTLYERNKVVYAKDHMKHEDALEKDERKQIFEQTYSAYEGLLKVFGAQDIPTKTEMHKTLEGVTEDASSIIEQQDLWHSVQA